MVVVGPWREVYRCYAQHLQRGAEASRKKNVMPELGT